MDKNGSTTWTILSNRIEINYYYNDQKFNLNEMLYKLNETVKKIGLQYSGWKRPFVMCIAKLPKWITDFLGRVIFSSTKSKINKEMKQNYSKMYNIRFLQDFVILISSGNVYVTMKTGKKFQNMIEMVSCSRLIWITNFSHHRRV